MSTPHPSVIKNSYGYYEVEHKPTPEELKAYYAQKYYQENKSSYQSEYTEAELGYMDAKLSEKAHVVNQMIEHSNPGRFIDIGCGEGFALKYFSAQNWSVLGLDYSDYGIRQFNPSLAGQFLAGDIYDNIKSLIEQESKFDLVLVDNVLEHVLDPSALLADCAQLLTDEGVLIIEVPNDFSALQQYLLEKGKIDRKFWVVTPDHISYFGHTGLRNLLTANGFETVKMISDYPIDFNLMNPDTNYVMDKTKGKNCHLARVEMDNFLHNTCNLDSIVGYYEAMAALGLGRQITCFAQKM